MQNILIYGLQKSGIKTYEALISNKEYNLFVYDDDKKVLNEFVSNYSVTEFNYTQHIDIAILSPSINILDSNIKKLIKKDIKITTELEFFSGFKNFYKIGITGTDGKTTTTSLLYQMIHKQTKNSFVCGNIGYPLAQIIDKINDDSIVTMEISSYQLEKINDLVINLAIILNLSVDHIDHHKSLKKYIKAKCKIFLNQSENDILIINKDDKIVSKLTNKAKSKKYYYSVNDDCDCYVYNNDIVAFNEKICGINEINLIGKHNLSNVLCAVLAAKIMNISNENIVYVIKKFKSLNDRLEKFLSINNVDFISDSKATNCHSALCDYKALSGNMHILIGGRAKKERYIDLFKSLNENVKKIYFFGESSIHLRNEFVKTNKLIDFEVFSSLHEATIKAISTAKSGEKVVLLPACTSFDKYKNFEERGREFKRYVKEYFKL